MEVFVPDTDTPLVDTFRVPAVRMRLSQVRALMRSMVSDLKYLCYIYMIEHHYPIDLPNLGVTQRVHRSAGLAGS